MIPETILVAVDPGEHAFRACAIRLLCDPEEPWHIFVACGEADRNLAVIETLFTPHKFTIGRDASMCAKLIVLFGRPWHQVLFDPTEVIGYQMRVLDSLKDETLERIKATPIEVLEHWAGESNYVHEGELLRAQITGDDALCLRN